MHFTSIKRNILTETELPGPEEPVFVGLEDTHWSVLVLTDVFKRLWNKLLCCCRSRGEDGGSEHHCLLFLLAGPILWFFSSKCPVRGRALHIQALPEEAAWFTAEPHFAQLTPSPKGAELGEGSRQCSYMNSPPCVIPGRSSARLSAHVSLAIK